MGRPWCSDAHPAECPNFRQGEQVSLTPPPIRSQRSAMDDSAWCHHYTRENCTQHCHKQLCVPPPPPPPFFSLLLFTLKILHLPLRHWVVLHLYHHLLPLSLPTLWISCKHVWESQFFLSNLLLHDHLVSWYFDVYFISGFFLLGGFFPIGAVSLTLGTIRGGPNQRVHWDFLMKVR